MPSPFDTIGLSRGAQVRGLALSLTAIGVLTTIFKLLAVTNATIVALLFLLVVVTVAAVSTRWIAIATSVMAFACFNFFFLPPVGTFAIADAQNWVALFTLLAVGIIASHLSSQVRQRAQESMALLKERNEAEVVRRGAELKLALLASLSHDLKSPLTAVTVAANNLNASWLTEEQRREQAELVQTELQRLNRLFEDIVELARIETNAVAAESEWVEPGEIVEAAAHQVERALTNHKLAVDVGADKVLVSLDPRLTSTALAHLLENAAQYSPPGSTISVRASVSGEGLQIAVRDRGMGIRESDLDRIFERFYRGSDARRHRFGTGVGLAITRGLLAAENARVWAENHHEGGAVFTILVPAESRPISMPEPEPV